MIDISQELHRKYMLSRKRNKELALDIALFKQNNYDKLNIEYRENNIFDEKVQLEDVDFDSDEYLDREAQKTCDVMHDLYDFYVLNSDT